MSNYTIIGVSNNQITLSYDGKKINFPIPIFDGLYVTGPALVSLLDNYVANDRILTQKQIIPSNLADILTLITPITDAELIDKIKAARDLLLVRTDWTQAKDTALTLANQTAWATYRTALRNLPAQAGFPTSYTWPVPPAIIMTILGQPLTDALGSPTSLSQV